MKNKLYIALLALVLVGFYFVSSKSQAANAPVTWEYKLADMPSEKKVNEMASEGWELVAIGSKGGGPSFVVSTYVFKRAKN